MKTTFKIIAIVLVVIISIGIGSVISRSQNGMANSDFFTFWLGARLQSQGADIYDPMVWQLGHAAYGSTWLENPRYVYPLTLAMLMIPLGWLPLQTAATLWITLSILAVLATLFLLIDLTQSKLSRYTGLLLILGIILFRPLIVAIRNGQLSPVYLLLLVLIPLLLNHRKDFLAGVLLGLLWMKPTLGIPISGLFLIYLLVRRNWKSVLGMVSILAVLWFMTEIVHSGWISIFLSQGIDKGMKVLGYSPTLWGLVNLACSFETSCFPVWAYSASAVIIIGAIVACILLSKRIGPLVMMLFAVMICLIITPYLWAYDQVLLLLPIITLTFWSVKSQRLLAIIPLTVSLIAAALVYLARQTGFDILSVLLTLFVFIWFIISRKLWIQTTRLS